MSHCKIKAGFHVSKSEGLVRNLEYVLECGGLSAQFYLSPKQGVHPGIPVSETDVQKILKMRTEEGLYIVVHGKLILNFARPHTEKTSWQQEAMIKDMTQAARIKANVILHQGKNVPDLKFTRDQAIEAFVQNLREILDKTEKLGLSNKIILENSCQQGTELGYTVDELALIYSKLSQHHQSRIGFCIDLCHIHVAGELNMGDPLSVEKFFQDFDSKIGLSNLEVIHFNDSEVKFNGHNDSHADVLVGYSGNPKLGGSSKGFKKFVELASKNEIPMILETPGQIPYKNQLNLILNWSDEVEQLYLLLHSPIIEAFTLNPVSSKGRKKGVKKSSSKTVSKQTQIQLKSSPTLTVPTLPKKVTITPKKKIIPMVKKTTSIDTPEEKKKIVIRKRE